MYIYIRAINTACTYQEHGKLYQSIQRSSHDEMKKHIVHTTISEKHWELLKKHTKEFESQQKVLEFALENMEKNSNNIPPQTPEEQLWNRIGREVKSVCIIEKEFFKLVCETADTERLAEYINCHKQIEYVLEYYYQKPLKECSLKEVMDGIVINSRTANWFETVNYTDDGNCYTLKITHNLNLNNSIINKLLLESLFRTYGAKIKIEISERSLFVKIFKSKFIE